MGVQLVETRAQTNPLFNDHRFKLGIFGPNVSNGCAMTLAEGRLETSWPNTRAIRTTADQAGFEALVPTVHPILAAKPAGLRKPAAGQTAAADAGLRLH